jgi:exportin-2 (importin alpha re-exporter)
VLTAPPRRLWSQIVSNFVVPQTSKLAVKDRKVAVVGLTRLLTQSAFSLKEPNVKTWLKPLLTTMNLHAYRSIRPALLDQLVGLFREPRAFAAAEDAGTGVTNIDLEEQAAGYQAAYSKLAAATAPPPDLVAYVGNVRSYVAGEFTRLLSTEPNVKMLVEQVDQNQLRPFLSGLGVTG